MHLYSDFSRVCSALSAEDIEVVALKGLHLAEIVYDDVGLRQMRDMDLLVRNEDLSRAQEVLFDMGYGPRVRPSVKEQCSGKHHLVPFMKKGSAPVEIHRSIASSGSPFEVRNDGLWERTETGVIAGVSVRLLSPADLLLHLCLHASFQHRFLFFALKNICDIRETLRYYKEGTDWEGFTAAAKDPEAGGYLMCTLQLVRGLLGTGMPPPLQDIMRGEESDRVLAEALVNRVFFPSPSERLLASLEKRPVALERLGNAETVAAKVRVGLRSLFPTAQDLRVKYGLFRDSKMVALFYLLHFMEVTVMLILLLLPERRKKGGAVPLSGNMRRNAVMKEWSGN
jgi:hypothetical protein